MVLKRLRADWREDTEKAVGGMKSEEALQGMDRRAWRWLFFGDSTVMRLFSYSRLANDLVSQGGRRVQLLHGDRFICDTRESRRCANQHIFGLTTARVWSPPRFELGEGPIKFGLTHPHCQDCSGCHSLFLLCRPRRQSTERFSPAEAQVSYGGYLSIEYARDVEMQSEESTTTQENIASFLARSFNSPALLSAWKPPVCIVSAGNHDVAIPHMRLSQYVENVKWYLLLLLQQCYHILWLTNTAPASNNFSQKVEQTQNWDMAVRMMLQNSTELRKKTSVIDVFEASRVWRHADNVHMDEEWYRRLGGWWMSLIQRLQVKTKAN
ncbi:hypothetical protein GUITHDRAFT_142794 [Guillardia theta CCMP2712]|uniref:SGNH hydrolase-type esterase domain-containing protein n=1 Tax=Guillardia theta (strain CCMP2712) TaxID=905079 RepID=L1IVN5_GUITC|nr:hypothetical protein GUITHDRAFT_142794 [Guillardia theta CCMP2712]EKX40286.1 hypothetical protein GUITHDRAFT_142794 [Guillardia theta CCMP2712]|eukprot:XP_005827266.1 hypothetical protein GUITHDRAFT_142794 [Guillardia theta CCMP2712]